MNVDREFEPGDTIRVRCLARDGRTVMVLDLDGPKVPKIVEGLTQDGCGRLFKRSPARGDDGSYVFEEVYRA